ncbi:hypothetical protein [Knoellia aerolata]|uniref:Uncharacterized protein n=1 Tax=Knoellia aerolata DSM 18566 TaxID=1385519 RepID=A0A0A0JVP7_9MICO|nr:hypothetical protein [Knoellia aerolata]KGN39706.1 hypothetical protein N801_19525 [Knoellia aerolata DSM 18566]
MADLTFSSFAQGPLGEAIEAVDGGGSLPPPVFSPSVTLLGPGPEQNPVQGPDLRLLGPGDVAGLVPGSVVRREPAPGASDVEPNYLACVELVPAELPWILTPARANAGRLRPWLVLVVLDLDGSELHDGAPLPFVDARIDQLPDLGDSWGWAHVQSSAGAGDLPGGARAAAARLARLVCPRRLDSGVTYRALLVPAFETARRAGLGEPVAPDTPHTPAWDVRSGGSVKLPVYDSWTFGTGPSGDFEELVARLAPMDRNALAVSSVRRVDVRAPWPGDTAISPDPQVIGVQGALCPSPLPPPVDPPASAEVMDAVATRLRAHLDAAGRRIAGEDLPPGAPHTLAPPSYGGRHVLVDTLADGPPWLDQLNADPQRRIAAGLGAGYVRANQEDLMAKAWEQVGAIREANRLSNMVELTTGVAERLHERHVVPLTAGETVAFAAPAAARARLTGTTTLDLELRMSRLPDGAASTAFSRRVRPAGKLARATGLSGSGVLARALSGDVAVPARQSVVPPSPVVFAQADPALAATALTRQLMAVSALAQVATVNAADGGAALKERLDTLGGGVAQLALAGRPGEIREAIAPQLTEVSAVMTSLLGDLARGDTFAGLSRDGIALQPDDVGRRVTERFTPGDSHWQRLASQTSIPPHFTRTASGRVMRCPDFPVPTALALLASDPEWFLPGLGALPNNTVALLFQNSAFIESYLVGINHELMRELLWREYPTDMRGTPFLRFWPRPDASPDIAPLHTWTDQAPLGDRLLGDEALAILLVRGDVVRRYPAMLVTAVPSGRPDEAGRHRPDPAAEVFQPLFVITIDAQTKAYAFHIADEELQRPATREQPGWFFVMSENGYRIRFGFDEIGTQEPALISWDKAVWPLPGDGPDGGGAGAKVPLRRGFAFAGTRFDPPVPGTPTQAAWNRDAADIARVTLQKPFRVAIQADVLFDTGGAP